MFEEQGKSNKLLEKPQLPEGWAAFMSKSTPGRPYYFNSTTGETSWEPPVFNQEKDKLNKKKLNPQSGDSSSQTQVPEITEPEAPQPISTMTSNTQPVAEAHTRANQLFNGMMSQSAQPTPWAGFGAASFPNYLIPPQMPSNQFMNFNSNIWQVPPRVFTVPPNATIPMHTNQVYPNMMMQNQQLWQMGNGLLFPNTFSNVQQTPFRYGMAVRMEDFGEGSRNLELVAEKNTKELPPNDLRLLLRAKRRRSYSGTLEARRSTEEFIKKESIAEQHVETFMEQDEPEINQNSEQETIRKKVSFILPEVDNLSENEEDSDQQYLIDVRCLLRLSKPGMRTDKWFVAVDTNVLVSNLTFVDVLVKSDERCRILVAYQVLRELDSMCAGRAGGSGKPPAALEVRARRARHYLHTDVHDRTTIEGQTAHEAEVKLISCQNGDDEILNCCLQTALKKFLIILLTNDKNLVNKASFNNVETFTVNQIKQFISKHSSATVYQDDEDWEKTRDQEFARDLRASLEITINNKAKEDAATERKVDVMVNTTVSKALEAKKPTALVNLTAANKGQQKATVRQDATTQTAVDKKMSGLSIGTTVSLKDPPKPYTPIHLPKKDTVVNRSDFISPMVAKRIINRMEEWVIILKQAMEGALLDHVQDSEVIHLPWTLHELALSVSKKYMSCEDIKYAAEKLTTTVGASTNEKGLLNPSTATKYMEIYCYAVKLIEALYRLTPEYEFLEAKDRLENLLKLIQNPVCDNTFDLCGPDPDLEDSSQNSPQEQSDIIDNHSYKPEQALVRREVIDYLKKNFPAWQGYVDEVVETIAISEVKSTTNDQKGLNENLKNNFKETNKIIKTIGNKVNNVKLQRRRNAIVVDDGNKKIDKDIAIPMESEVKALCKVDSKKERLEVNKVHIARKNVKDRKEKSKTSKTALPSRKFKLNRNFTKTATNVDKCDKVNDENVMAAVNAIGNGNGIEQRIQVFLALKRSFTNICHRCNHFLYGDPDVDDAHLSIKELKSHTDELILCLKRFVDGRGCDSSRLVASLKKLAPDVEFPTPIAPLENACSHQRDLFREGLVQFKSLSEALSAILEHSRS